VKIELIVQNADTGKALEISELVSSISWSTYVVDQPGKLVFAFIDESDKVLATEGSVVSFKVDGTKVFFGYVFKEGVDETESISITAYDQLRYLKNKDTYVLANMTASQVFEKVCKDFKLRYSVIDKSSYVLPSSLEDNKGLYEIIQKGMDLTLINSGNWYVVRDNFGTLEYQLLNRLKTLVFIGDGSSLSKYSFESSIDDDTYNQIKLVKENKDTAKREIYIVKDSSTIKTWGTLQYFETVDEASNAAQIQARAEMLLKLKNRKTKSLKLNNVLGDLRVFAGAGVVLGIKKLVVRGIAINKYFMVTSATHTFANDLHTMSLELQVSI
jgi:hypothetical protein